MDEKIKDTDITIENGVASWDMIFHGAVGGSYMGNFKFRCFLTPMQLIEADRDFRELIGTNAQFAATNAENVAYALAQLKQRVLESPPFWRENAGRFGGGGIKDMDVLDLVLEAAVASEVKFRKELTQRHEESINRIKELMEKRKEQEKINQELADEKQEEKPKKAKK